MLLMRCHFRCVHNCHGCNIYLFMRLFSCYNLFYLVIKDVPKLKKPGLVRLLSVTVVPQGKYLKGNGGNISYVVHLKNQTKCFVIG